jgi:hypothetical protein
MCPCLHGTMLIRRCPHRGVWVLERKFFHFVFFEVKLLRVTGHFVECLDSPCHGSHRIEWESLGLWGYLH